MRTMRNASFSLPRLLVFWVVGLLVLGALCFGLYRIVTTRQAAHDRAEAALAPQGQLPQGVRPLHYDLRLRVDPDQDDFSGSVGIDLWIDDLGGESAQIGESAGADRTLWIHGEGIRPSRAELIVAGGRRVALDYHEMGGSGVVRLRANEAIPVGKNRVEIDYEVPFDTTLEALYLFESEGRRYAVSQLEAIDARQVFPSFDEPRFKVPFDLALEVRDEHEGVTTTPEKSSESLGDGYRRMVFETTPPLPTYLLAFAVGPYDIAEADPIPASAIRSRPIPLRGLATQGKGEELAYALKNTAPIVLALEDYFGRPYPYRKLDLAAVPDFNFGAMENVGLIVYRETLLLLGENPGVDDIRAYVSVHAHELAHQWFGNLVTMPWWDDIWLNESFATWMGNLISNRSNPTLEFGRETVRDGLGVMNIDVYADTRRIREPVAGREEIANAFDWISYAKGGAFLQMLEDWIGPERFQQGIRDHLERHAEGTAGADDFLASLSSVAEGKPVVKVARSFLEQRGLPLVEADWECEEGRTTLTLRQSRYLEAGSKLDPNQSWTQPFCALLVGAGDDGRSARACTLIDETPHEFSSVNDACPVAVLPNAGAAGYFRWTLDDEAWDALLSQVSNLDAAEKLSVASNLAADFRSGRLSASAYLARIPAIIAEPEWDVVTSPIATLGFISDFIAKPAERPALARYVASLYAPHLEESGSARAAAGAEAAQKLLRSDVLYLLAVTLKDPEYVGAMASLGRKATGYGGNGELNLGAVEGDLLTVALASAIQQEGAAFFADLKAKFEASKDGAFRRKALNALGVTTEPALAAELRSLGFLWGLRLNEIPSLIYSQNSRLENRPALFAWLKRGFPIGHRFMPERYVSTAPRMASGFCDSASRDDLEAFFSDYVDDAPGMARNLSQVLERIELCESLVALQDGLVIPPSQNVESLTHSSCRDLRPSRVCPSPIPNL